MGVSIFTVAMLVASADPTVPEEASPTAEVAAPALAASGISSGSAASPGAAPPAAPAAQVPDAAAGPAAVPLDCVKTAAPAAQGEAAQCEVEAAEAEHESIIVVNSSPRHVKADPLSGINAASFEAIAALDKAVVAPVAGGYEKVVPRPVRNGLRNVLINLAEPVVFLNYLLQFKPGKAMETAARFGINSTIGVAGLFDMAKRKPFRLPYRQNGFANTFAYHGIGNGPYLFLPVLGPTTVRDLVGRLLDLSVLPTVVGRPFNTRAYGIGTGVVKAMNDRVAFDEQILANRAKADPYVATRDFYLKQRQAEINALHSARYRARKGIPDPVLPAIQPHVNDNAVPGSPEARPVVSVPSSTGLTPAAPAPAEPVPGAPVVVPAPPAPGPGTAPHASSAPGG